MQLSKLWDTHIVYNQFLVDFQTKQNKTFCIKGLQGSALSFFISSLALAGTLGKVVLYLAKSNNEALYIYQDLLSFTGWQENKNIYYFPPYEILPYEDLPYDEQIVKQRIRVLATLAQILPTPDFHDNAYVLPIIIVSTYRAILPKIMCQEKFRQQCLKLKQEDHFPMQDFLQYLIRQGYKSSNMIERTGQFSQRGGIIDVFPSTEENPVRIEWEGDRIASLRFFDLESQRSMGKTPEIVLLPPGELTLKKVSVEGENCSFFDYLPKQTDIFIHQFLDLKENILEFERESQKCFLVKKEDNVNVLPPQYYYLTWKNLKELLSQKQRLVTCDSGLEGKECNFDQDNIKSLSYYPIFYQPIENYFGNLELFFQEIKKSQQEKKNILVLTSNKGRAVRLAEIFEDRGFTNYQMKALPEVDLSRGKICLGWGQVSFGFSLPELSLLVITEKEIFTKQKDKGYKPRRFHGKPFYQLDELKIGDYVVHISHGIGRYAGVKARLSEGIRKDYILIQYAAGDELYVPIEKISQVHKYIGVGGSPPKVNRLGDSAWKITTKRVKESIQKLALDLLQLYQKRKEITGFSFSPDTVWQQELEMAFPFEETPDQEKATKEVKKDMESSQPMERLICGDVGYGKTEIAIRAAFKAVMDGKQVAVLAPTTILAQQHWENFTERMKAFPVRIEMLSRFKSKKEQKQIINELKKGQIDIIIGTHRLVQNDVSFKDLGLLVVDEEQRFGVIHKERIKKLRAQIDSLTLTATPIPRTLYMSLTGIREMSIINTPPELRLPIITFFRPKSDETIREALRRELERGGQVYYVHNRVQDIEFILEKIKKLVPEAKVVIAHGQMPEDQLEKIMIDFLNRKYDVLLCTTIIEIGLDIPNVNTIIIDDAQKFGLAQLYQLRGRVGRSNRRAYAYLLYPSQQKLSDNARKRLEAIKEFSDLGSGFRLAMRDLEIRGAGNLLGKEQHGLVSEVGFHYYCQLLEESINQLRKGQVENMKKLEPEPEIELNIESYIPEYYISSLESRINYYQRLGQIKTISELNDLKEELKDIYGSYPEEVENLLLIVQLKIKLKNQEVTKIRITNQFVSLRYQKGSSIDNRIKNILPVLPNNKISYQQRGNLYELKLWAKAHNHSLNSTNLLWQTIWFLDQVIPA